MMQEHKKARQTKRQEQQKWEEENFWKDQPSLDAQGSIDAGSALPGRTASLSSTRQASFDAHQTTSTVQRHFSWPFTKLLVVGRKKLIDIATSFSVDSKRSIYEFVCS